MFSRPKKRTSDLSVQHASSPQVEYNVVPIKVERYFLNIHILNNEYQSQNRLSNI